MPAFWRHALPEEIQWLKLPQERLATCENCLRTALGECHSACQCCTYFPQLPNFSVGFALQDKNAAPSMLALLKAGHMLPQGLLPSPAQMRIAANTQADDLFGTILDQRCPFLEEDTLNCAIYPYRNSVCSTFFCHHDHGPHGSNAWFDLQLLVGHIETGLAQWAMEKMGMDVRAYTQRLNELAGNIDAVSVGLDKAWSLEARKHLWQDWFSREEEFFLRCAEHVRTHQTRLFEIACAHPMMEARVYEQAVRNFVPEPGRSELPMVSADDIPPTPIEELWYRVQLNYKRLWALPFNEGRVRLNDKARITENSKHNALALVQAKKSWQVHCGQTSVFMTHPEHAVLKLFGKAQRLNEEFMQAPELLGLKDPRAFIAECLRLEILVHS